MAGSPKLWIGPPLLGAGEGDTICTAVCQTACRSLQVTSQYSSLYCIIYSCHYPHHNSCHGSTALKLNWNDSTFIFGKLFRWLVCFISTLTFASTFPDGLSRLGWTLEDKLSLFHQMPQKQAQDIALDMQVCFRGYMWQWHKTDERRIRAAAQSILVKQTRYQHLSTGTYSV